MDRHTAKLLIAIFSKDPKGNEIGEYWKTLELKLEEEGYQQLIRSEIACSMSIPREVMKQTIDIAVYDAESQNIGARRISIR